MGKGLPPDEVQRMRRITARCNTVVAASRLCGLSKETVRKYAGDLLPVVDRPKPREALRMPPPHLQYSERIMDYAPTCSASMGPWLEQLPDRQLSAVWKAVTVEQWGECNRADALSILRVVDKRFVKVTDHGRDTNSTRSNADPHRAA